MTDSIYSRGCLTPDTASDCCPQKPNTAGNGADKPTGDTQILKIEYFSFFYTRVFYLFVSVLRFCVMEPVEPLHSISKSFLFCHLSRLTNCIFLFSSAMLGFSSSVGVFFCPLHTGVGDMVMATVRKGKPELRKKGEPLYLVIGKRLHISRCDRGPPTPGLRVEGPWLPMYT